mmetsp:Transcript_33595/g.96547  ORF Transcript_33595/g.96547 Transcript_33595/m.96547 type:complete len:201 (+) Transcript_33595:2205-2807(+)
MTCTKNSVMKATRMMHKNTSRTVLVDMSSRIQKSGRKSAASKHENMTTWNALVLLILRHRICNFPLALEKKVSSSKLSIGLRGEGASMDLRTPKPLSPFLLRVSRQSMASSRICSSSVLRWGCCWRCRSPSKFRRSVVISWSPRSKARSMTFLPCASLVKGFASALTRARMMLTGPLSTAACKPSATAPPSSSATTSFSL